MKKLGAFILLWFFKGFLPAALLVMAMGFAMEAKKLEGTDQIGLLIWKTCLSFFFGSLFCMFHGWVSSEEV